MDWISSPGSCSRKDLSALWNGVWLLQTILLARMNLNLIINCSRCPNLKYSNDFGMNSLKFAESLEMIFKRRIAWTRDSFWFPPIFARIPVVVWRMSRSEETSLISASSDSSLTPMALEGRESSCSICARNSSSVFAVSLSRRYSKWGMLPTSIKGLPLKNLKFEVSKVEIVLQNTTNLIFRYSNDKVWTGHGMLTSGTKLDHFSIVVNVFASILRSLRIEWFRY